MTITCSYCGSECEKSVGHVNRARKVGLNLFCNKKCAGLSRRVEKSEEEKKRLKAEYDKVYRATNPTLKKRKADYHKANYNAEKQRNYNKTRYPKHLEYLRRPEYKNYKKQYDELYRAKKLYGEFADAAIALKNLEDELESKQIKLENGIYFNKSTQQRKRKWKILQVKT
jgi:ribosomal protein L24E